MDFFEYVETWATIYRHMMHTPEAEGSNRRFFICDGMAGMADFLRSANPHGSPCVLMESSADGYITAGGIENRTYVIYFCTRSVRQQDGHAACQAKEEARMHACKFLRYMHRTLGDKAAQVRNNFYPDFKQVDIITIGPFWDGWNAVQLSISAGSATDECISEDLVVT